jgi:hypothetical protein
MHTTGEAGMHGKRNLRKATDPEGLTFPLYVSGYRYREIEYSRRW